VQQSIGSSRFVLNLLFFVAFGAYFSPCFVSKKRKHSKERDELIEPVEDGWKVSKGEDEGLIRQEGRVDAVLRNVQVVSTSDDVSNVSSQVSNEIIMQNPNVPRAKGRSDDVMGPVSRYLALAASNAQEMEESLVTTESKK
jgi:preprotein translocase subunit YajC